MAKKRNTWWLRNGDVIYVEEHHDGMYGAPGEKRLKKAKPTKEQMQKVNAMNKEKRARMRLLQYFNTGDCFATWTYDPKNRPGDMKEALAHFQKAMRYVRREYKKRGRELFWIRNIEKGTKGAWHIHLVINEIGDTASILERAWEHGVTYCSAIKKNSKVYDEDFSKLASYITKDENSRLLKRTGNWRSPGSKKRTITHHATCRFRNQSRRRFTGGRKSQSQRRVITSYGAMRG